MQGNNVHVAEVCITLIGIGSSHQLIICADTVVQQQSPLVVASYPGSLCGQKEEPGIHCLRMCQIFRDSLYSFGYFRYIDRRVKRGSSRLDCVIVARRSWVQLFWGSSLFLPQPVRPASSLFEKSLAWRKGRYWVWLATGYWTSAYAKDLSMMGHKLGWKGSSKHSAELFHHSCSVSL